MLVPWLVSNNFSQIPASPDKRQTRVSLRELWDDSSGKWKLDALRDLFDDTSVMAICKIQSMQGLSVNQFVWLGNKSGISLLSQPTYVTKRKDSEMLNLAYGKLFGT